MLVMSSKINNFAAKLLIESAFSEVMVEKKIVQRLQKRKNQHINLQFQQAIVENQQSDALPAKLFEKKKIYYKCLTAVL